MKDDPRTDTHPHDGGVTSNPPPGNKPKPAEGGVGTGTKGDPAEEPGAQPHKQ
jgi:hypothetical protein